MGLPHIKLGEDGHQEIRLLILLSASLAGIEEVGRWRSEWRDRSGNDGVLGSAWLGLPHKRNCPRGKAVIDST